MLEHVRDDPQVVRPGRAPQARAVVQLDRVDLRSLARDLHGRLGDLHAVQASGRSRRRRSSLSRAPSPQPTSRILCSSGAMPARPHSSDDVVGLAPRPQRPPARVQLGLAPFARVGLVVELDDAGGRRSRLGPCGGPVDWTSGFGRVTGVLHREDYPHHDDARAHGVAAGSPGHAAAPATVPALAAIVVFVVWATSQAGYPLTHWAPGALIVLVCWSSPWGRCPLRLARDPAPGEAGARLPRRLYGAQLPLDPLGGERRAKLGKAPTARCST